MSSTARNTTSREDPVKHYNDNYVPPNTARSHHTTTSSSRPHTQRSARPPAATVVGMGTVGLGPKCRDDYSKMLKQRFEMWKAGKEGQQSENSSKKRTKLPHVNDREQYDAERKREREMSAAQREETQEDRLREIRERAKKEKEERKKIAQEIKKEEDEFHQIYVAENVEATRAARRAQKTSPPLANGGSSNHRSNSSGAPAIVTPRSISPNFGGVSKEVQQSIEEFKKLQQINRSLANEERQREWERARTIHNEIAAVPREVATARLKCEQDHKVAAVSVRELLKSKWEEFGGEKQALKDARGKWAKDIHDSEKDAKQRREDWMFETHEQGAVKLRKEKKQWEQERKAREAQRLQEIRERAKEIHDTTLAELSQSRKELDSARGKRAEDVRIEENRIKQLAVQEREHRYIENIQTKQYARLSSPVKSTRPTSPPKAVSPPSPIPLKYRPRPPQQPAAATAAA